MGVAGDCPSAADGGGVHQSARPGARSALCVQRCTSCTHSVHQRWRAMLALGGAATRRRWARQARG